MEQAKSNYRYDLGIIIPTYNESENIVLLLDSILNTFSQSSLKLFVTVVDDSSPDKTYTIVEDLIKSKKYQILNLSLVIRPAKSGLASAYIQGFSSILDSCEFVMSLDADLSHNPEYVPKMVETAKNGYDLVIGSRYIKGGGIKGWGLVRTMISRFGSFYSQILLISSIKDQTGGFNLYRGSFLKKANISNINAEGYLFQIQMKHLFERNKAKIMEVPIIFVDRLHGKSKFNKKIFFEASLGVIKLATKRIWR